MNLSNHIKKIILISILIFFPLSVFAGERGFIIDLTTLKWQARLINESSDKNKIYEKADVEKFPVYINKLFPTDSRHELRNAELTAGFNLTEENLISEAPVTVFFVWIGEHFTIYINNKKITNQAGNYSDSPMTSTSWGNYKGNFPRNILKHGNNTISIKLSGYSPLTPYDVNIKFGLGVTRGDYLGDAHLVDDMTSEKFPIFANIVYFTIGIFFLLFFIISREKPIHLIFGLASVLLSAYLFHRTSFIFELYTDKSYKLVNEILLLIPSASLLSIVFYRMLFKNRSISKIIYIQIIISVLLFVSVLINPGYIELILRLWQFTFLIYCVYFIYLIIKYFNAETKPPKLIIFPLAVIVLCSTWDILDAWLFRLFLSALTYGFFVMIMTMAIILIRDYVNLEKDIVAHNVLFGKFVPLPFISLLGKNNIIDLKLGDQIKINMAILFSDIRSFTTLSETMSASENFNFINEYLKVISPVIRENKGFIDKYMGDGIMSLFPDKPDDALNAATKMLAMLDSFNKSRLDNNKKPIRIGIGVHTGDMMLGTVGEEFRMETTVISDAVNLGSRVESLTKEFGVPVIFTEATLNSLKNKNLFDYRKIGKVMVKGKIQFTIIYELITDSSEKIRSKKLSASADLENALDLFEKKKYKQSLSIFQMMLKKNPKDLICSYYLSQLIK